TTGYPGHDFLFARRQSRKLSLQVGSSAVLFVFHAGAFKRDLDGVQQILIAKWFGQKLDSSSLHCLHCHGYIAMSGDENYWDFSIGLGQLGLKLQAHPFAPPLTVRWLHLHSAVGEILLYRDSELISRAKYFRGRAEATVSGHRLAADRGSRVGWMAERHFPP